MKYKENYSLLSSDPRASKQLIDSFYSQENNSDQTRLYQNDQKLIEQRLLIKDNNYSEWRISDNNYLGQFFSNNFLNSSQTNNKNYEFNRISSNYNNDKFSFNLLDNEWTKNLEYNELGLDLKSRILRLSNQINLRSLGIKLQIQISLKGQTNFSLFMRSNENFNNKESYIIQYKKEGYIDNMRLFGCVGTINELNHEYSIIKKSEIPINNIDHTNILNDKLDLKIEIIDFGNDKIKIKTNVNEENVKPFKLQYSNLLCPYFSNFHIYLIGNGENIYLKSMMIEIFDVKELENEKIGKKKICARCNCKIF